jgi:hypothetical protein
MHACRHEHAVNVLEEHLTDIDIDIDSQALNTATTSTGTIRFPGVIQNSIYDTIVCALLQPLRQTFLLAIALVFMLMRQGFMSRYLPEIHVAIRSMQDIRYVQALLVVHHRGFGPHCIICSLEIVRSALRYGDKVGRRKLTVIVQEKERTHSVHPQTPSEALI